MDRFAQLMKTSLAIWTGVALGSAGAWAGDYPVRPVPFTDVRLTGGFWQPRIETNRQITLWYDFRKCEETGRIANFARAGKLEAGPFEGIPFNDSDVFKVMEGAAYILALQPDPKLDVYLDGLIAKVAAAQEPDGYLYTARTLGSDHVRVGPSRWSKLRVSHELYNVGHMYEAAVAHYQATGKRTFLEVALRNADLIAQVFGPVEGRADRGSRSPGDRDWPRASVPSDWQRKVPVVRFIPSLTLERSCREQVTPRIAPPTNRGARLPSA